MRRYALLPAAIAVATLSAAVLSASPPPATAADPTTVTVSATTVGPLSTQISTNNGYAGMISQFPQGEAAFRALQLPFVRLHVSNDGHDPPAMPEVRQNVWWFDGLNSLVNDVTATGQEPVMNLKFAPDWMWTCSSFGQPGHVRDLTFRPYAEYMARIVSYYNKGSMTTANGQVITNPAGTSNRMTYWELWNEPDLSNETPCVPPSGQGLTPEEYLTMWNAVAPAMRAVDPTIKLVGPATANGQFDSGTGENNEYIWALMERATIKPDVLSFHGYGHWENTVPDKWIFDGDNTPPPNGGIDDIVRATQAVHDTWPNTPIWISEINVNAAWSNDPNRRPWTQFAAAWWGSTYIMLAPLNVSLLHQYNVSEAPQFGLIDDQNGAPLLPYWIVKGLNATFPVNSTRLETSSPDANIQAMAARRPDGKIAILVVNKRIENATSRAGRGLPADLRISLTGITPTAISLQQIDSTTSAASGPLTVALPTTNPITVQFPGYGMALITLTTGAVPIGPTISGFTPTSGPIGTTVTLTGTNFTAATTVRLGSVSAPFTVNSGTSITATVPSGAYSGSWRVTTPDGSATSADSFTVTGEDNPPVATDDTRSGTEDVAQTFAASTLVANDDDAEGSPLQVTAVSNPTHGTVALNSGQITFTPELNYNGAATFDYTVSDGALTDTGSVTVNLAPVNDSPVAVDDARATVEDTDSVVAVGTLRSNDTDVDGDPLVVSGQPSGAVNGTATRASNQVTFRPSSNYYGVGGYDYTVSDGNGGTDVGHVTVTISAVNDPPVAGADTGSTARNTPINIDVLANDVAGPPNEPDAVAIASFPEPPEHGTAVIQDGEVRYTPAVDYQGFDSFEYLVCDNGSPVECARGTVSVTITGTNRAPVAADGARTTAEDTPVPLTLYATDPDGNPLTFSIVNGPSHGTLGAISGSSVTYTPAANYHGADSFTFRARDGSLNSNTATVSLSVTPVNDAPVSANGSRSTAEDTSVALTLSASDVDSGALTFSVATGPSHGTLGAVSGSSVTYTPAANYNGSDSFTFRARDGSLDSNAATVSLSVTSVNDPPAPAADAATAAGDGPVVIDPLPNDAAGPPDEAGQAMWVAAVGAPNRGSASLITSGADAGKIRYQPSPTDNAADAFSYQACDRGTSNGSPDSKCADGVVSFSFSGFATPLNTGPPSIRGVQRSGDTLQADTGQWSPGSLAAGVQWQRCDRKGRTCSDVAGATASSYLVRVADIGRRLRLTVMARNRFGSTEAASPATSPIRSQVVISRVQFDSPGPADKEVVTLANVGRGTVELRGWAIRDGDGNVYRFPRFKLKQARSVAVETGIGRSRGAHVMWRRKTKVWDNGGERVALTTPAGEAAHSCAYKRSRAGKKRC